MPEPPASAHPAAATTPKPWRAADAGHAIRDHIAAWSWWACVAVRLAQPVVVIRFACAGALMVLSSPSRPCAERVARVSSAVGGELKLFRLDGLDDVVGRAHSKRRGRDAHEQERSPRFSPKAASRGGLLDGECLRQSLHGSRFTSSSSPTVSHVQIPDAQRIEDIDRAAASALGSLTTAPCT